MINKSFIEKLTGYWFYKSRFLPAGVSLKHDIGRFNHGPLKTIFDVGANVGQTFFSFSNDFPGSHIYCFEPVDKTFRQLIGNTGNRAIHENFAFGETEGQKEISLFSDWSGGNSLNESSMCQEENAEKQVITIKTIDNYCLEKGIPHLDLLKIDTEGYELNVLRGADAMLREKKISFILCETGFLRKNLRNTNFSELAEFLAGYGYFTYAVYSGGTEDWDKGMCYGNVLFVNSEMK